MKTRPDWVAEVLSPSTAGRDLSHKQAAYWIVDPEHETLTVHRHHPDGYLAVKTVTAGDVVALEPFGDIQLRVGDLFGRED